MLPKHLYLGMAVCITLFMIIALGMPVLAAPPAQYTPFPTPTPGPDGKIIYIAQENDSAWRISAIFNIPLEQLKVLNNWGDNPVIHPGDAILLGYAGPAENPVTPGPTATPAPQLPTASPLPGWGNICVILYNDLNGDSLRQEEEPAIPQGAISVTNRPGTVSKTDETVPGLDPVCFNELPEGEYTISVAVPKGYNSTTVMNLTIKLSAGDISYLPFGAQANSQTLATQGPGGTGGAGGNPPQTRSPFLAIAGIALIVLGVGAGLVAAGFIRLGRKRSPPPPQA